MKLAMISLLVVLTATFTSLVRGAEHSAPKPKLRLKLELSEAFDFDKPGFTAELKNELDARHTPHGPDEHAPHAKQGRCNR